jgi:hypothetical protein
MRKTTKKLTLSKETIKALEALRTEQVVGGYPYTIFSKCEGCDTDSACTWWYC